LKPVMIEGKLEHKKNSLKLSRYCLPSETQMNAGNLGDHGSK